MDFREQIKEDIALYAEAHPFVPNIEKPEWAFNYWILDKLFCEDEDEIVNKIIDYSDHGIDCYVWHEETKDLYLIQNKYYGDESTLEASYFNDAVQDGYSQLKEGTYSRSEELQLIFNQNRIESDFYVYHYFYVTNNNKSQALAEAVQSFNENNERFHRNAQVFYLDDIRTAFYGKPIVEQPHHIIELDTPKKGTRISVDNKNYRLGLSVDAKYIMLPVTTLYYALCSAEEANYPIFDANIREYLGTGRSVNKGIIKTLESEPERKNFFFYNNGITIICKSAVEYQSSGKRKIVLEDPQIVNGCQTVSSIKHVLSNQSQRTLEQEFEDAFVMTKVIVIPTDEPEMNQLRKNIVKFNNSQNSIDEKTFQAIEDSQFWRLQQDFMDFGFLVLRRQSDKETFKKEYKQPTKLQEKAQKKLAQFGLQNYVTKTQDFFVPLEKLLQVILAFKGDARQAFQKKGSLLNSKSDQYKTVTSALNEPGFTTHRLLDLYLLYLRADKTRSDNNEDGKIPIPWYFIEGFSKIECNGGNFSKIDSYVSDSSTIDELITLYTLATSMYLGTYVEEHPGEGYNSMIKESVDMNKLRMQHAAAKAASRMAGLK